jgi:hypothetical protein
MAFLTMDNIPKCDQYDDDYEDEKDVDYSKNQQACCWQEEYQLQLKYDNQPLPNNHDGDEENEENFRVREKSLPLCFSSFKFRKRNSSKL